MGISRREVQGNGRKQVIGFCGDMKEKGTEATRTRVLVESMKTGKWGRGRHCEGEAFTHQRSIYGVAGNRSQDVTCSTIYLEETGGGRERRDPQAEEREEQGRSGTQRLTCPQQDPMTTCVKEHGQRKWSSSH